MLRPELVAPPEAKPVVFDRMGMGWVFRPPDVPVIFTFDRLRESREEPTAEVHVTMLDGSHIGRDKVPLMGSRKIVEFARELSEARPGADFDWKKLLIEGCEATLEAYRQGTPVMTLQGPVKRRTPIRWQWQSMVMANVINCWLASATTGKSTFAKAYALHHAAGIDFLGHEIERGVPLYLDYEDTYENFEGAMYEIAAGLDIQQLPTMHWKKGGGPIRNQIHEIAAMVDSLGITLIIIDSVAAASGSMGEKTYEAVALELEQALMCLPPVTVLLIDHVTGDEMKNNAIPIKARGASRKYEFVRYQWTLVLDREQAHSGKHVVGWTHTKTNATKWQQAFAVEVYHDDDRVSFGLVDAVGVAPMAANMGLLERCVAEVERAVSETGQGLTLSELCIIIYGGETKSQRESIRTTLKKRDPKNQTIITDEGVVLLNQRGPRLVRMPYGESDADLPF